MTELIEPAHYVDGAPGNVGSLIKRLKSRNWTVTCQRSVSVIPEVLFLSDSDGHVAGEVRFPAYSETIYSVYGHLKAGRSVLAVDACFAQREGKGLAFQSAKTYDPILQMEIRVGWLKPRKPNEWEIANGVTPPLGFKQWLDMVAPEGKK